MGAWGSWDNVRLPGLLCYRRRPPEHPSDLTRVHAPHLTPARCGQAQSPNLDGPPVMLSLGQLSASSAHRPPAADFCKLPAFRTLQRMGASVTEPTPLRRTWSDSPTRCPIAVWYPPRDAVRALFPTSHLAFCLFVGDRRE